VDQGHGRRTGNFDVRVRDSRIMLEYSARSWGRGRRLEVPVFVASEISTWWWRREASVIGME